jgi:hypothetical protein
MVYLANSGPGEIETTGTADLAECVRHDPPAS